MAGAQQQQSQPSQQHLAPKTALVTEVPAVLERGLGRGRGRGRGARTVASAGARSDGPRTRSKK